ncbi:MAG: class I SAM-dependent methyltransferase [Spirochaetes bacterium]|nr:class I SAM-dependent methyltransferase [Spirochaetota bacterium]
MKNFEKFSTKVSNYEKYRPSYPDSLFIYLKKNGLINQTMHAADIGAGTGIFTALLAPHVKSVFAVEPNEQMMASCRKHCNGQSNVGYIISEAEQTGLQNASVDLITAAQSFHWFDRDQSKTEFKRILKPEGNVMLIWNSRIPDSAVNQEYEEIIKRVCSEFKGADFLKDNFQDFFREGNCSFLRFPNNLSKTLESFIGGALSASYAPDCNDSTFDSFINELTQLFVKHSINNILTIPTYTRCCIGKL